LNTNDRVRREAAIWVDTLEYSYVLYHADQEYDTIWDDFARTWRPNGSSTPRFTDVQSSDPMPKWWPAGDGALWAVVVNLIERVEKDDDEIDLGVVSQSF
jgi:hypothetical protein